MADLIDRAAAIEWFMPYLHEGLAIDPYTVVGDIRAFRAVNAVELPCKIGDRVWAIRSYKDIKQPQEGIVSEMFFTGDMRLMIVVKHVARGLWGETVFGSYKEAWNAIEERKENVTVKENQKG